MWQVADTTPPKDLLFQATGTFILPEPPFLYMYIEQDHTGPFNALQSDLISCQSENSSQFSFRY